MQQGLSDENYNSVQHYHDHPDFTDRERLAAEYAERFATVSYTHLTLPTIYSV